MTSSANNSQQNSPAGNQNQRNKTFGVAPSPFNAVKLELGVLLVVGVLLLVGLDSITPDPLIQVVVLFSVGVAGMMWILWRTHQVIKQQRTVSNRSADTNPSHLDDTL